MKKWLLCFISMVLLIGCSQTCTKLEVSSIYEVDYDTLIDYENQNVNFMLYIGRDDCSDCYYLSNMIKDYTSSTNTGVIYFNLKTYKQTVTEDKYNQIFKKYKFDDVPVLMTIYNGKVKKQFFYLDESYFNITDRPKQKEERKKYDQKFVDFMNAYFEEDYEMS